MKLLLPSIRLMADLPDFAASGKEGAAQKVPGGICLRVDANISCPGAASQNSSSRQPWHKGSSPVGTVKPGTGGFPDPFTPQELQFSAQHANICIPAWHRAAFHRKSSNSPCCPSFSPHFALQQIETLKHSGTNAGVCPAPGQGREDGEVLKIQILLLLDIFFHSCIPNYP